MSAQVFEASPAPKRARVAQVSPERETERGVVLIPAEAERKARVQRMEARERELRASDAEASERALRYAAHLRAAWPTQDKFERLALAAKHIQAIDMARLFPSLVHVARNAEWSGWCPSAMDAWAASLSETDPARHAVRMILAMWSSDGDWECGTFSPSEAKLVWDEPHRCAYDELSEGKAYLCCEPAVPTLSGTSEAGDASVSSAHWSARVACDDGKITLTVTTADAGPDADDRAGPASMAVDWLTTPNGTAWVGEAVRLSGAKLATVGGDA